jgi:hypothetical protein
MLPRRVLPLVSLLLLPSLACGLLSGVTLDRGSGAPDSPADVQDSRSDDATGDEESEADAVPSDAGGGYGDNDSGPTGGDGPQSQVEPADIPVFDGPKSALDYADATTRSYQLDQADYDEVVGFYQNEMLANGWEEDGSQVAVVSADAAVLYYVREGRAASVTISVPTGTESVMVMVLVTER